jgi:hypothetical protein
MSTTVVVKVPADVIPASLSHPTQCEDQMAEVPVNPFASDIVPGNIIEAAPCCGVGFFVCSYCCCGQFIPVFHQRFLYWLLLESFGVNLIFF